MPNLTIASFRSIGEMFEEAGTPYRITGVREYVRKFLIEMDEMCWGPLEVSMCPSLPSPASPFINPRTGYFDGLCLLTEASVDRFDKDSVYWVVTCKYTNDIPRGGPPIGMSLPQAIGQQNPSGGVSNNPDLEPPEVEYDFEEVNVPSFMDLNSEPFLNSAWEPFTPAPTIPRHRTIFVLTRNELTFNMQTAANYAGSVNNNPYAGFPTDSVLCMAPRAKMMYRGPFRYWRVTYRLKFGAKLEGGRYESFQHEELDQGYRERFAGAVVLGVQKWKYAPALEGGKPVKRPVLLNGSGRRQTEFRVQEDPDVGLQDGRLKPVFLTFKTRRRLNFANLFNQGLGGILPP